MNDELVPSVAGLAVPTGMTVPASLVWEIVCYLILFGLLLWQKPLVNTFLALDLPRRLFLGGFLLAMLAGHLIDRSARTYPVVAWSMFTRPVEGDPIYHEYTGTLESGRQVDLRFDDLFPNTLGRNTIVKMTWLAKAIAGAEPGPDRDAQVARYETTLRALGRKYNATHARDPVIAVQVWECCLPLKDYRGTASIRREPFWAVAIARED